MTGRPMGTQTMRADRPCRGSAARPASRELHGPQSWRSWIDGGRFPGCEPHWPVGICWSALTLGSAPGVHERRGPRASQTEYPSLTRPGACARSGVGPPPYVHFRSPSSWFHAEDKPACSVVTGSSRSPRVVLSAPGGISGKIALSSGAEGARCLGGRHSNTRIDDDRLEGAHLDRIAIHLDYLRQILGERAKATQHVFEGRHVARWRATVATEQWIRSAAREPSRRDRAPRAASGAPRRPGSAPPSRRQRHTPAPGRSSDPGPGPRSSRRHPSTMRCTTKPVGGMAVCGQSFRHPLGGHVDTSLAVKVQRDGALVALVDKARHDRLHRHRPTELLCGPHGLASRVRRPAARRPAVHSNSSKAATSSGDSQPSPRPSAAATSAAASSRRMPSGRARSPPAPPSRRRSARPWPARWRPARARRRPAP